MKDFKKLLLELNKKYPDTPVLTGAELGNKKIDRVSTGSAWLDYLLDGGFPRGRITEIYGPPSSGKSLISLRTISQAQKNGLDCVLIDAEQAFDSQHAAKLGVDINKLIVVSESGGETAIDIVIDLLQKTHPGVVVIDSVASLIPEVEEEESVSKQTMALQARLMSKAMRELTKPVAKANTALIFINQIREQVGAYGNPEVTSGGKALGFYASVRVDVRRGDFILLKGSDEEPEDSTAEEKKYKIGHSVKFKVTKSKVSKPWGSGYFDYYYKGIVDEAGELMSLLEYTRKVTRRGAYYDIAGKTFQGRSAAVQEIRKDPKFKEKVLDLLQSQNASK